MNPRVPRLPQRAERKAASLRPRAIYFLVDPVAIFAKYGTSNLLLWNRTTIIRNQRGSAVQEEKIHSISRLVLSLHSVALLLLVSNRNSMCMIRLLCTIRMPATGLQVATRAPTRREFDWRSHCVCDSESEQMD